MFLAVRLVNSMKLHLNTNLSDLNIENLWSILKSRVAKRHPESLEDLETFALEEFYAIPDEYVQNISTKN